MSKSRRSFLKIASLGAAASAGFASCGDADNQPSRQTQPKDWSSDPLWRQIRYGAWKGPGVSEGQSPMDDVLLKDYAPKSSLVTPHTLIRKARFPAIDVHVHHYYPNQRKDVSPEVALNEWAETQRGVGVERSVVLTGSTGEKFDAIIKQYLKGHSNQFQVYCGLETNAPHEGDYTDRAIAELERCHKAGARGVGELSDKGFGLQRNGRKKAPAERLHADDPRLTPFWERCGQLGMPVNIHVADHPSAWSPPDVFQERTPVFQQFNKHGDGGLSHEEIIATLVRTVRKHPQTTFIACHLANLGHDLHRLSKLLDSFPNLYVDISARDYELGRQPRSASRFLTKYAKRVLFGTDMGMEETMYQNWWRLLESADEHFEGRVWWRYYGLELPDSVLEDIYRNNALSVLSLI